jgi:hypothetical protein
MILDVDYAILQALINRNIHLKMDIYYKNIFGVGFHEQVSYYLYLDKETQLKAKELLDYLLNYNKEKDKDLKRHKALKKTVPSDAKEIFNKIRDELNGQFKEDLLLKYRIDSSAFDVKIINYEEAICKAEKYLKDTYTVLENNHDVSKKKEEKKESAIIKEK